MEFRAFLSSVEWFWIKLYCSKCFPLLGNGSERIPSFFKYSDGRNQNFRLYRVPRNKSFLRNYISYPPSVTLLGFAITCTASIGKSCFAKSVTLHPRGIENNTEACRSKKNPQLSLSGNGGDLTAGCNSKHSKEVKWMGYNGFVSKILLDTELWNKFVLELWKAADEAVWNKVQTGCGTTDKKQF
jgi:hypothetical protein